MTRTIEAEILPPPRPQRAMAIKNLSPNLPERGKIKIGAKGAKMTSRNGTEFQPPKKLDHFIVTTLERGADGNFKRDEEIHRKIGDKPKDIPVRLLYDDPTLNFPTRYACYNGRQLWCSGDGEQATRMGGEDGKTPTAVKCPCPRQNPDYAGKDKCKMNGVLSVLIEGAGGLGGVWKARTTSYNSVVGLLSSMAFLRSVTGGPLANIPLTLTVRPKQATDPSGNQQIVYVLGLEYVGDIASLQGTGQSIALERAKNHVRIEHIEDEARRLLLNAPADVPLPGDTTDDVVEEFYPEQVGGSAVNGTTEGRPTREQFSGEAGPEETQAQAGASTPEESFELVDESGVVEMSTPVADDWAKELIAAVGKGKTGKEIGYLRNNRDAIQAVADHVQNDELAQHLLKLLDMPTEPEVQKPAADENLKPIEMPQTGAGKPDSAAYLARISEEIGIAPAAELVDRILKREGQTGPSTVAKGSNLAVVMPGTRRSIKQLADQRKAALAKGEPK